MTVRRMVFGKRCPIAFHSILSPHSLSVGTVYWRWCTLQKPVEEDDDDDSDDSDDDEDEEDEAPPAKKPATPAAKTPVPAKPVTKVRRACARDMMFERPTITEICVLCRKLKKIAMRMMTKMTTMKMRMTSLLLRSQSWRKSRPPPLHHLLSQQSRYDDRPVLFHSMSRCVKTRLTVSY